MSVGVGITDMFIYRSRTDNAWEYVQQETKLFDLLHQEIFRNHRYDRVQWQDIEKEVPPFPEIPENQVAKTWKDNFQFAPENPENFPAVLKMLKNSPQERNEVYLILYEDRYETLNGDGKFLTPYDVFLEDKESVTFIKKNEKQYVKYFMKPFQVILNNNRIETDEKSKPDSYEHYHLSDILKLLEKKITNPTEIDNKAEQKQNQTKEPTPVETTNPSYLEHIEIPQKEQKKEKIQVENTQSSEQKTDETVNEYQIHHDAQSKEHPPINSSHSYVLKSFYWIMNICIFIIFTIITQVGGLIYLFALLLNNFFKIRFRCQRLIVFIGLYFIATFLIIPVTAPIFGREKVKHTDMIKPATYMTVVLNRNYVRPALNNLLAEASKEIQGTNIQIAYLDVQTFHL
jgi:hypothetical protein